MCDYDSDYDSDYDMDNIITPETQNPLEKEDKGYCFNKYQMFKQLQPIDNVVITNMDLQRIIKSLYVSVHSNRNRQMSILFYNLFDKTESILAYDPTKHKLTEPVIQLWKSFVEDFQKKSSEITKAIERSIEENIVDFETLWFVYRPGQFVITEEYDSKFVTVIDNVGYQTGCGKDSFCVSGHSVSISEKGFMKLPFNSYIYSYSTSRPVADLSIKKLTETQKEEFSVRGKRLVDMIGNKTHHYCMYNGRYHYSHSNEIKIANINSRIVIDQQTYKNNRGCRESSLIEGFNITDNYFMIYPILGGYDLHQYNVWGMFDIDNITEINYYPNAFDKLIIPGDSHQERKNTIIALLDNFDGKSKDIVQNKNSGLIILLHGLPGTGKTMTAEVAAEHLKRPLYYVTTGSLGLETNDIEISFQTIMNLARRWNAIVLLDEADIFLESRGSDIHRNSIVGTFLKILEYYNGIFFMTTNRIKEFDIAVHSRIHVVLKYESLDGDTRIKIWKNMIADNKDVCDNDEVGCNIVRYSRLNGRQLRTVFNVASTLARKDKETMSQKHIDLAFKLNSSE